MIAKDNLKLGIKASRNATLALAFLTFLKGGLKISLKNSGKHFPYGYYKAENIIALFVSLLILFSGVELLNESFSDLNATSQIEFQGLAFVTAVFSVVTIYGLSLYKRNVGARINSQSLIADAVHSYTDVFSSMIVVVAILGSMLGISKLDILGTIIISLLIFKMGIESARDAVLILMDAWLDEE